MDGIVVGNSDERFSHRFSNNVIGKSMDGYSNNIVCNSDNGSSNNVVRNPHCRSVPILRLRGGGPSPAFSGFDESEIAQMFEEIQNNPRGANFLNALYENRSNPVTRDLVMNAYFSHAPDLDEQLALASASSNCFHPALEGVIDDKDSVTSGIDHYQLVSNFSYPLHLDGDSFYWISTSAKELFEYITVVGVSMFNFDSITNSLDTMNSARWAITGSSNSMLQRVRGKKPSQINLERYPNIRIASIDTGKSGVTSYVYLYYLGLEYIPNSPIFRNEWVALLNIAFNLARTKIFTGRNEMTTPGLDVFAELFPRTGGLPQKRIYQACVQSLPAFEGRGKDGISASDGMKAFSTKRINRQTSMKGAYGQTFLRAFFEVIEKIANDTAGYTADDDIWNYHFHGMGRDVAYRPSELIRFAKSLWNNMIITSVTVGVQNHFMGEHVSSYTPQSGPSDDTNAHLKSVIVTLKSIFNLPTDDEEHLSSRHRTKFFGDFGLNLFPRKQSRCFFPDGHAGDEVFRHILSEQRNQSEQVDRPPVFEEEEFDEILDNSEDSLIEEIDINSIMVDYEENKRTSFSMLASNNDISNFSTGRIILVLRRDASGKLAFITNARNGKILSGCQLYGSWTKHFFRHDVRDAKSLFNKFPTYILELLSHEDSFMSELQSVRKEAKVILDVMEDSLHHVLSQMKSFGRLHVRFEGYFDLSESRNVSWPRTDPFKAVFEAKTSDLRKYFSTMCGRTLPQLRRFVDTEFNRTETERTNLSVIPATAKTKLYIDAEIAVMLTNPSFFESKAFKTMSDLVEDANVVPLDFREDIPENVQSMLGIKYGVSESVLRLESLPLPSGARSFIRTTSTPLSRVLAARLQGKVVNAVQYLEHYTRVQATFLKYAKIALSSGDGNAGGLEEVTENDSFLGFFQDIDFEAIRTKLTGEQASEMMIELSRLLISLYDREWHHHLMVSKKRRSTQVPVVWPIIKNKLEDLPTTFEEVVSWRSVETQCSHIQIPSAETEIQTEGEISTF